LKLRVAKWGNSLAVRLPAEYTQISGLKEGDSVEGEISVAGAITLIPAQPFNKSAFLKKVRKLRAGIPMTSPTVETMRQDERY
jgi:antitoxin MazE